MEKEYELELDRKGCIGAAICCAVSKRFWKFNDKDGKVDLADNLKSHDNDIQTLEIEEKDFKENYDAAISCPVRVIHIKDLKTGKKLI